MTVTPTSYFEERWDASDDPWDNARRWYEARKYDLTVAVLPRQRYARALEPACGVGLLTRRLATRAERVDASDRFARSVETTTARCTDLDNVAVTMADVRDGPAGHGDLVVLGEVLYYFDERAAGNVADAWWTACESGGHLVAVHYRPVVAEHVLTGDDVHDVVRSTLGRPVTSLQDPLFLIDVFAK